MPRLELIIRGRVQGVAFRHHTLRHARQLGLTGWVRNQPDGSVRIVAEGPDAALLALEVWAGHGPDHARVESVEAFRSDAAGTFLAFEVTG